MPSENDTRPCKYPGCNGTQTFESYASIAGSQVGTGTNGGEIIRGTKRQPAWVCNKNREHYELAN